jgi:Fe-S-cluster containining protein
VTSPRDQFDRKVCDCAKCCVGCRTMPGSLIPGDVERIADHLGVTGDDAIVEFAKKHFCAGFSIVGVKEGKSVTPMLVRTISPQQRPDGSCVFLGPNHQCTVHPVSPYNCSHFDAHMPDEEADKRSKRGLMACNQSSGYRALHEMLTQAGKIARLLKERKDAFNQAYFQILKKEKERNEKTTDPDGSKKSTL